MPANEIAQALADHWDAILPHLTSDDVAYIAAAVRRIEAEPEADAESAAADIGMILITRLPAGHPLLTVITSQPRLARGGPPALADRAAWSQILSLLGDVPGPGADDAGGAPAGADSWLLAAPALTETQVRERGGDPGREDLIRLRARTGEVVLPEFQFGPVGAPLPVVAAINRLLAVVDDPWGVADWWLGRNAWLGGIPADLLGRIDDDLLMRAARAELPGD